MYIKAPKKKHLEKMKDPKIKVKELREYRKKYLGKR
jgi:hypothetical protein